MSRVRVYGPLFAHLFAGINVDEEHILDTWSVEKFERYKSAADQLLELKVRQ